MNLALIIVFTHAVAAVMLGWLYFRRFQMTRPPIGVFNLADVSIMMIAIVLIPFLYLALPTWIVATMLLVGTLSLLYFTLEPILVARWAIWLAALLLVAADVGAAWRFGTDSTAFFAVNNLVLIVVIVGATNLWAQSGMKARDATILGAALVVYDFTATSLMPLMTDLITRLAGLPFAPVVAWRVAGQDQWVGIGLGDLLLATVFPLVMRKAYGRTAGIVAMALALVAIGALFVLGRLGFLVETFPVMIVLGPIMVLQYAYWRRRLGEERASWQYMQAEPLFAGGARDAE